MDITYLLGAGASYNALPIVSQISNQLENFINKLHADGRYIPLGLQNETNYLLLRGADKVDNNQTKKNVYYQFIDSLTWLKDQNDKHFSIDTFAKKLYLQKDIKNLQRLKITLACFFVYLQNTKKDNRYDSFFAAILDDLRELPKNIKILSWNYDYQTEIAFSNFIQNNKLRSSQNYLNVYSKGDMITDEGLSNKFCVFKLNGTTSLDSDVPICEHVNEDEVQLMDDIITYYDLCSKGRANLKFSFAWEEDRASFLEKATENIINTEVLIIIGYSFPFFNRKIDSKIFESMPALRTIYIQDPYQADAIEERIESILDSLDKRIEIKKITMKDQFYIPFNF